MALAALLAGNRRFARGQARQPRQDPATLRRLAAGQHPTTVVLGCADSRVPPEILFDQGLGDVFDNRLAGNVVDDLVLGSVEYAVRAFGSPLVVVLGHERCGAIAATVEAIARGEDPPDHVGAIVAALRPVVAPALGLPGDPVENGCRANIRAQVRALRERSPLLADRVDRGRLLIVGARYDLDDGLVTLVRPAGSTRAARGAAGTGAPAGADGVRTGRR
ncbi:carbonic anhydrase [Micromonospora citrea]|uniref:carbonic anhydrase n=1 Tax=Micromonospora citrea TaxID=47855 RepID=UPI003C68EC96